MPTINVRTMRAPESEESCLQISSTLPEQLVPSIPSRALHVKKSNTTQSATESASRSSSQGSRPPTGQSSRGITHPGRSHIQGVQQVSHPGPFPRPKILLPAPSGPEHCLARSADLRPQSGSEAASGHGWGGSGCCGSPRNFRSCPKLMLL